jgi:hypothetical protein
MTPREEFISYVQHGGDRPLASLQIGAGAGFDAKLAGKSYNSEATVPDIVRAYETVGGAVLINVGLPEPGTVVESLRWEDRTETDGELRTIYRCLETPYGELKWKLQEAPRHGVTPIGYPLTVDDRLDAVRWYAEQFHGILPHVPEMVGPIVEQARNHGALCIQWNLQPFELMGLLSVPDLVMHAMSDLGTYRLVCDDIRDVNIEVARAVVAAGADFVFLGGPGVEMMSPRLYDDFIIPDSQEISQAVHEAGGLIYSHICSPIEPLLSKGYYNRMGLDLFETLSPPPVGNVQSLGEARQTLDDRICTRGNVGLDVLVNGTVEEVERATRDVLEATRGTKHITAASDYLFYDIPIENAQAVVRTVEAFNG